MITLSEEAFNDLVSEAIDAIPKKFSENIKNLAFVVEDYPSIEQRTKLGLHSQQTLFGLYEGIPLTKRSSNYNWVLPDKITIFKKPAEAFSQNLDELREHIKHTVWHEVAHYFGLDHDQIFKLERND